MTRPRIAHGKESEVSVGGAGEGGLGKVGWGVVIFG